MRPTLNSWVPLPTYTGQFKIAPGSQCFVGPNPRTPDPAAHRAGGTERKPVPSNRISLSAARPRRAAAVCAFTLTASLGGGLLGALPANAVVSSSPSITGDGATFDLYSDSSTGANIQEGTLNNYYGPGSDRSDAFDGFGYVVVNGTPVSGNLTS
ncbi:MAG: hypothetical protein QOD91_1864, partial [Frankiales bacterium]|nr:hypothetical protein [Frankiales bacterium]